MKQIISLALFISLYFTSNAGTVDTVNIYSKAMQISSKCVVIKPSSLKSKERVPVVYLLHGWSGNYSNWITKVPRLKQIVDLYKILIVCPDGGYSSWYFDSPVDSTMKYETYIAKEVTSYIDAHYPTIKNRNARAITGLSMGGHGGLFLSFRHSDIFGACGSMSGGVDLNESRNRFDIMKRLGDTTAFANNWINYSVLNVIEKYPKDTLSILVDCGLDDIFIKGNQLLHEKMVRLKIPHDYIERPGSHNWEYWSSAVEYEMFYFDRFFRKANRH